LYCNALFSYTRQEISNFVLSTDFTSKSDHPVCQDIQLNHCIPNKNTEIILDPGLKIISIKDGSKISGLGQVKFFLSIPADKMYREQAHIPSVI
jgi:hypothetical protein